MTLPGACFQDQCVARSHRLPRMVSTRRGRWWSPGATPTAADDAKRTTGTELAPGLRHGSDRVRYDTASQRKRGFSPPESQLTEAAAPTDERFTQYTDMLGTAR